MKSELTFPKKKKLLFGAVAICVVLIASLAIWSQTGKLAEAAVLVPPSLPSGLVGWWRFDEGIGTVAGDSSGNGNNGVIYGAIWVTGKYGQGLQFASNYNSRVQVPYSSGLAPTTAVSVECWANMIAPDTIVQRDWGNGYNLIIQNGKAVFAITDPANNKEVSSVTTILNTGWHHLVGTFDGTTVKIYVDGVMENSLGISGTVMSGNAPLMVGANNWGGGGGGVIDEVRIYNRALSAAEVLSDFQTNPGFASQLVAKIPKGTTQVITTLSWQGAGSINASITAPSGTYTEDTIPVYQKTTYSTSSGNLAMLNVKRLSISVTATSSDQSWTIALTFDSVAAYQISVEVQK